MLWKVMKPSAVLVAFVATMAVSIVIIRYGTLATAKAEEKLCGKITGLDAQYQVAYLDNDKQIIHPIPTRQAFNRLAVGREFTFVYRHNTLVAIGDGNLCGK
jgi:hypothetical protein